MNIFSNSIRLFSKPTSKYLLKSIKLTQFPLVLFSEKSSSQKKCAYNKTDFYNLLTVTKKNQPKILESLKKYPDKNYIFFLLQMAFEMNFGTPEFLEVLVPKFLKLELNNPIIILNLYRGIFHL